MGGWGGGRGTKNDDHFIIIDRHNWISLLKWKKTKKPKYTISQREMER